MFFYEKKNTNVQNINEDLMDKETNTDPGNEIIDIMEEEIANNSEDHTRESDIRNRNRQITNINTHKNEKKRKPNANKKEKTEDKDNIKILKIKSNYCHQIWLIIILILSFIYGRSRNINL